MELAHTVVENHIHDQFSNLEDETGAIPKPLVHAMKLIISNFYENREPIAVGVSVAEMPFSLEYLLDIYKNRTVA